VPDKRFRGHANDAEKRVIANEVKQSLARHGSGPRPSDLVIREPRKRLIFLLGLCYKVCNKGCLFSGCKEERMVTEEITGVFVNSPFVLPEVQRLLASDGLMWTEQKESLLARHAELIQEWNPVAGLVSEADVHDLGKHYIDSLSLGGIIKLLGASEGRLLGIGTGGGFPAIPLKILFPSLKMTVVERNEKKIGFLHKVVADLGLSDVRVVEGEFPGAVRGQDRPNVVTSRAVEKPEVLRRVLSHWLPRGVVYLCQYDSVCEFSNVMFHVEQCGGLWSAKGFRRGTLRVVRRI